MAKLTGTRSLIRSKAGTTPELEIVTRRRDNPNDKSSNNKSQALYTASSFNMGSPMPIKTTLEIRLPTGFRCKLAINTWAIISAVDRFRLKP